MARHLAGRSEGVSEQPTASDSATLPFNTTVAYLGQSEGFDRVIRVSQSPLQVNPEVPGQLDWLHSLEQPLQNGHTQSSLFPKGDTTDLIHILSDCKQPPNT